MKYSFKTHQNFNLHIIISDKTVSLNYRSDNDLPSTRDKDLLKQIFISKDITDRNRRVVICLENVLSEIKGNFVDKSIETLIFDIFKNLNNVVGNGLHVTV